MSAGLLGLNPVSFIHTVDCDVFVIPGGLAEFICSRLAGGNDRAVSRHCLSHAYQNLSFALVHTLLVAHFQGRD